MRWNKPQKKCCNGWTRPWSHALIRYRTKFGHKSSQSLVRTQLYGSIAPHLLLLLLGPLMVECAWIRCASNQEISAGNQTHLRVLSWNPGEARSDSDQSVFNWQLLGRVRSDPILIRFRSDSDQSAHNCCCLCWTL